MGTFDVPSTEICAKGGLSSKFCKNNVKQEAKERFASGVQTYTGTLFFRKTFAMQDRDSVVTNKKRDGKQTAALAFVLLQKKRKAIAIAVLILYTSSLYKTDIKKCSDMRV